MCVGAAGWCGVVCWCVVSSLVAVLQPVRWCGVVFTGCSVARVGVLEWLVWLLVVDWLEWLVCCVILHHPPVIVGVVG